MQRQLYYVLKFVPLVAHSQRRGCDEPKDPENGYFSYYSTTNGLVAVGDYITYGCNPNYLLHGAARVYCYSAGWSHQPSCASKVKVAV